MNRHATALLIVLLLAFSAAIAIAQPPELPEIDADLRAAIVDSLCASIDSVYVDGEGAALIIEKLRANLAAGAYDDFTDVRAFARRLDEDAQATHHDGHFGIRAFGPAPPPSPDDADAPDDGERELRLDREANFGFRKVEILSGNVGYLRFDRFADTEHAAETAIAAMNYLANSYAIIIDLRQNGGGSASMIRLICSYFFTEREHLINWYQRETDVTIQSYSYDYVPGRRMPDTPVYVLTSRRTFSAAEEFTFDLKHLERATVVGETTGGGGNTVVMHVFDFEGFRVGIRLPHGKAMDPNTGEGWEGVGVAPHIEVPADDALTAAHLDALTKLRDGCEDPERVFGFDWAIAGLETELNPVTMTVDELNACCGHFGPRRIFMEDGALHYQREDRPKYRLVPMGEGLFSVGDLGYFRLRIELDDSGRAARAVGVYDDGNEDIEERTGD